MISKVIRQWRTIPAALLGLAVLAGPAALAQQTRSQSAPRLAPPAQAPVPAPEPLPPAYEPDMLKLAETIGSLAFLRELCGGPEAPLWRMRMTELIEAEGVTAGRRERLAGAYNRGYRGFALTYRTCTAAAEEATARLSLDGQRLSRSLGGRFGG